MMSLRRVVLILLVILMMLLFLAVPGVSLADTLEEVARDMARKIAAALPARQGGALDVQNLSTMAPSEVATVRLTLESELRKLGHPVARANLGHGWLKVQISENIQQFLFVAEVPREPTAVVVIVPFPKNTDGTAHAVPQSVAIQKQFVVEQLNLILDFQFLAQTTGDPRLAVLDSNGVTVFESSGQEWRKQFSESPSQLRPWPRDLRGWLDTRGNTVRYAVPGLYCERNFGMDSVWNCGSKANTSSERAGPGSARLGDWVSDKDYFRAYMFREYEVSPEGFYFYAAEPVPGGGWFATGLDGRLRLFDSEGMVINTFSGWGSEIAGVNSTCGTGQHLLATQPGDWTSRDAIQAYEVIEQQPTPVGVPLQLEGPITALWSSGDEAYARAVVRNLKTGHYEAYKLTIACGQ